jgi:hypothetical protein
MVLARRWTHREPISSAIIFSSFYLVFSFIVVQTVYAEERITIFPDAHSSSAVRFVDIINYFIPVGENITWFNDDFIDHKFILMNEDNSTRITEFNVTSKGSFSYTFEEPGKYYYSSENYPKIQGSVSVLDPDSVSIKKIAGLKNKIDIQLAWTPVKITLNEDGANSDVDNRTNPAHTNFIITFVNNETGMNQQHIDYDYSINDESGSIVYKHESHSTYGTEEVEYYFEESGSFNPQVMITNILFAPVDPDLADFGNIITVEDS